MSPERDLYACLITILPIDTKHNLKYKPSLRNILHTSDWCFSMFSFPLAIKETKLCNSQQQFIHISEFIFYGRYMILLPLHSSKFRFHFLFAVIYYLFCLTYGEVKSARKINRHLLSVPKIQWSEHISQHSIKYFPTNTEICMKSF
jgi:hypothetical protein